MWNLTIIDLCAFVFSVDIKMMSKTLGIPEEKIINECIRLNIDIPPPHQLGRKAKRHTPPEGVYLHAPTKLWAATPVANTSEKRKVREDARHEREREKQIIEDRIWERLSSALDSRKSSQEMLKFLDEIDAALAEKRERPGKWFSDYMAIARQKAKGMDPLNNPLREIFEGKI